MDLKNGAQITEAPARVTLCSLARQVTERVIPLGISPKNSEIIMTTFSLSLLSLHGNPQKHMNNTLFISQYKIRFSSSDRKSLSSLRNKYEIFKKAFDIEWHGRYNGFYIDMSIPFSESATELLSDELQIILDANPKINVSGIFDDPYGQGVLSPSLTKEYLTTN